MWTQGPQGAARTRLRMMEERSAEPELGGNDALGGGSRLRSFQIRKEERARRVEQAAAAAARADAVACSLALGPKRTVTRRGRDARSVDAHHTAFSTVVVVKTPDPLTHSTLPS